MPGFGGIFHDLHQWRRAALVAGSSCANCAANGSRHRNLYSRDSLPLATSTSSRKPAPSTFAPLAGYLDETTPMQ